MINDDIDFGKKDGSKVHFGYVWPATEPQAGK